MIYNTTCTPESASEARGFRIAEFEEYEDDGSSYDGSAYNAYRREVLDLAETLSPTDVDHGWSTETDDEGVYLLVVVR